MSQGDGIDVHLIRGEVGEAVGASQGKRRHEEGSFEGVKRVKTSELLSQDELDLLLQANMSSVSSIEGTPEIEMIINRTEGSSGGLRDQEQDVVAAQAFLDERYDEQREVRLAQKLLRKKRAEDQGLALDSDSEGEDFEDLLEMFGIDPDEVSLDLGLNQRQKLLMDSMDDEQQTRYETFRRSNLNINGVRKLVNGATGINVPNDFAKIIAGVGKVFVGQIVERAKDLQRREAETKVVLQLKYLTALQYHEKATLAGRATTKPEVPTFYDSLLQSETSLSNGARRDYTSDSFRVIVPRDTVQLTPDHIRDAWLQYVSEGQGSLHGRWRQQGGGSGSLFR